MSFPARSPYIPSLLALAVLAAVAAPVVAQDHHHRHAVGVIVDRGRASNDPALVRAPFAHVFNPATMQITASVQLPSIPFAGVFDVEISPDLREAYIGDTDVNRIWVIDLHSNPPALAAGTNPILLDPASASQDIVLSPDGRWLVSSSTNFLSTGGSTLSVTDVHRRVEVSTYPFQPSSPTAVEFAPDGSLLVGELVTSLPSSGSSRVHRFRIDAMGALVPTGDVASETTVPAVQNLLVPNYPQFPGWVNAFMARHTVFVSRPAYGSMGSLRTRGLTPVATVGLPNPSGIDLCFDPFRSMLYVRTNELGSSGPAGVGNSRVDGYRFSPFTGQFGAPIVTVALERRAGTAFGVEQTAVDPVTRRLFVSGLASGEVRVFDSMSGAQVGSITDPNLTWALGIAVRNEMDD